MLTFQQFIEGRKLPIYRGVSTINRRGGTRGSYWTPDKDWARQFTQTGRDAEIKTMVIDIDRILRLDPLPHATSEEEFDGALDLAQQQGYAAVWFDEGPGEPDSVFVLRGAA